MRWYTEGMKDKGVWVIPRICVAPGCSSQNVVMKNIKGEAFCEVHLPENQANLIPVSGPIVIRRQTVEVSSGYVPGNANSGFVATKYD